APRWMGRCPECGAWSSLVEEPEAPARGAGGRARGMASGGGAEAGGPVPLRAIEPEARPRLATGLPELDRVIGGGLVPGSAVLLGGEPGIGKSTLGLQL